MVIRKIGEKCDAFISWNNKDEYILKQIVNENRMLNVADSSITVWDSNGSGAFGSLDEIKYQIDLCETFIVIISKNSIKSQWVYDEFMHAYEKNGMNRILPIIIDYKSVEEARNDSDCKFDSKSPLWKIMSKFKDYDLSQSDINVIKETISKMILNTAINKIINTKYDFEIRNFYEEVIHINDTNDLYIERTLGDNISEDDLLSLNKYILVYSNGGMGKTALLRHLNNKINHLDNNELVADDKDISLYFECKKVARYLKDNKDKYIFDFIINFFESHNNSSISRSLLNGMLNSTRYQTYLLLDSYDEIMDPIEEKEFINGLLDFIKSYQNVKIILSSRNTISALDNFKINDDKFINVKLNELNDDKIKKFGKNLFAKINSDGLYEDFYLQLKDIDDEIKGNPLFLSQLIFIYKIENKIPFTKIQILEETTKISTIKIDENRDIKGDIKSYLRNTSGLLSHIAYNSMNSNKQILDIIKDYIDKKYKIDDEEELNIISENILSFFNKRTIIKENRISPKIFYDFYASKYIYNELFYNKKIKDLSNINELFLNHYFDNKWTEALKLFICKIDNDVLNEEIYKFFNELFKDNYIDGNYDIYYELLPVLNNKDIFKEILIKDLLNKSINNILNPYQELFYYIPEYNLFDDLIVTSNKLISNDKKNNFILISIIRDLLYISKDIININEITNNLAIIDNFKRIVLDYGISYRNALNAKFYGVNPNWLLEYEFKYSNCNIHPFYFNLECMSYGKESGRMGSVPLTNLYEDELGLYKHISELKNGEYIGLLSTDLEEDIVNKLTYFKAQKVREIILNPKYEGKIDEPIYINKIFSIVEPCGGCLIMDLKAPGSIYYSNGSIIQGMIGDLPNKYYLWNCEKIPNSAFFIGDFNYFFSSKSRRVESLVEIIIPPTVKIIGEHAFTGCNNLKHVTFTGELDVIEDSAFNFCSSLEEIILPKGIKEISDGAFFECGALKKIYIPDTVKEIGAYAFYGCASLKRIDLPKHLTTIGKCAFSHAKSLEYIDIPDSVTKIGTDAFSDCPVEDMIPITKVIVDDDSFAEMERIFLSILDSQENNIDEEKDNKIYVDDFIFTKSENILILEKYVGTNNNAILPNTVINEGKENDIYVIGESAFRDCPTLKGVDIPSSVLCIGDNAFSGCDALSSINMSYGVEELRSSVFEKCKSITSIIIPDSVYKIGNSAFSFCSSLESLKFPKEIEAISGGLFYECKSLKEIVIPSGVKSIEANSFNGCESLKKVVIPNTVTAIEFSAFSYCYSLEEIILPEGLVKLGAFAFNGSGLKSIIIPPKIRIIDEETFDDCVSLEEVILPAELEEIKDYAFSDCRLLRHIEIPLHIKKISASAFYGCSFDSVITLERFVGIIFNPADFSKITKLDDGRYELKK